LHDIGQLVSNYVQIINLVAVDKQRAGSRQIRRENPSREEIKQSGFPATLVISDKNKENKNSTKNRLKK
jgi:hypothetical protein